MKRRGSDCSLSPPPPSKYKIPEPQANAESPDKGEESSTARAVSEPRDDAHEPNQSTVDSGKRKNVSRRRDAAGYPKSRGGKEKDGKNTGRRSRRGTRNDEKHAAGGDEVPKAPRLPKRQCALLIGFCGSGYSGMQIQPFSKTIEGVLFKAMVAAGAVSQDNADDPVKINLGRAARTDAGVHAAGNVVSLKMITEVPGVADMAARINEELPPEIRLWGYVRVQNSFSARLICDSRKYTYFFPTYLLIPPKPGCGLDRSLQEYTSSFSPVPVSNIPTSTFWVDGETSSREEDLLRKRSFRVAETSLTKLREAAQKFEGTHNFHNFTVGRVFSDRSNQRHMKKIEISNPTVHGETEWISVLFHGQSFMLHQIRKMMSALILSCRTSAPKEIIDELYGPHPVFIPKMPSLGLLLEQPIFDSYNTRMSGVNEKLQPTDADYRPPIDFNAHHDEIAAFKQKYIYNNMREVEDRDGIFNAWLMTVDSYSGNDLLYLNPRGIIPPAAVIKRGERRENPFKEKKIFDATSFSVTGETKTEDHEDEDEEDEEDAPANKSKLADTEG